MDNIFDILVNLLDKKCPTLGEIVKKNKDTTLGEYINSFKTEAAASKKIKTIQNKSDFIEASIKKAEELYGYDRAAKLRKRLDEPYVFTAAHTGPLFNCILVQGTLIFAFGEIDGELVPTYTFGDIPLNNTSYPRGIVLSNDIKIPLFPDRLKNSLAAYCTGFKSEDVENAKKRTEQLFNDGKINDKYASIVKEILEKIFASEDVLALSSLSDQASRINTKLWKYLFADDMQEKVPDLLNLQIEDIASDLIFKDFHNKDSLIFNMFFDENLRDAVLKFLDGIYGAWTTATDGRISSGTTFFWGVDDKGRGISLKMEKRPEGIVLAGQDISGGEFMIPFSAEGILDGLKNKKILPGLFLTFATISFACGILCYGGFMQTDYLTNMKEGLLKALKTTGRVEWADCVNAVKTDNYSNGFEAIIQQYPDGALYSAGAIEIISSGGISMTDIEEIRSVNIMDATIVGFIERFDMIYKPEERTELPEIDFHGCFRELSKKLIVLK